MLPRVASSCAAASQLSLHQCALLRSGFALPLQPRPGCFDDSVPRTFSEAEVLQL